MSTPSRCHRYDDVTVLSTALHVPVCACSVKPTWAVPLTPGSPVVGMVPGDTVTPEDCAEVVLYPAFFPVTVATSCCPTIVGPAVNEVLSFRLGTAWPSAVHRIWVVVGA